jgi:NAD(P)-dependent dehydrogenase (short-subunit alcohol dehydrogenase family)
MKTVFAEELFKDKVAIVTGGGTGIGLRTARELARLGATVILGSRSIEKLEKGKSLIESEGGKAFALECNIREEESVQNFIQQAIERAGTVDYLVNNAGGQFASLAEKITHKGWHAVIELNLTGPFLMSKEVFTRIFKEKGGVIVNVLVNMWNGFPMMSHTGAARSGTKNLTKSLATEWGRFGVRVNSVAPGIIDSAGLKNYPREFESFVRSAAKFNQTYRLGTEAEVAAAILFLLSPGASFITGETIRVDGGESIYSPWYPPVKHNNIPPFDV